MSKRSEPSIKRKLPKSKKQKISNDEDIAFPRGGKGSLSNIELKKINEQVKQELLFSTPSPIKPKKQNNNKKNKKQSKNIKNKEQEDNDDNDDSFEGIIKRLDKEAPKYADHISFKNLNEDSIVLACIKEIRNLKLIVTLPGSLDGFISITEISNDLNKRLRSENNNDNMSDNEDEEMNDSFSLESMFSIGQIVKCIVKEKNIISKDNTNIDQKKYRSVELSLKPSLINKDHLLKIRSGINIYGSISSEEDYGYIVNFGKNYKPGFLKKEYHDPNIPIQIGQPMEFIIHSSFSKKKSTSIPLTTLNVTKTISSQFDLTIQSLQCGILSKVKIIDIVDSGLIIRLFDFFNASIPLNQIEYYSLKDISSKYKKGDRIIARIIYIDYENKIISCSIKPHYIDYTSFNFNIKIGDIFEKAKIISVKNDLGLHVKLPSNPPQIGFIHYSNISDSKTTNKIENKYDISEKISCRVTDFNYADGICILSMKKSVMDLDFLQHSDLEPGTSVRGIIVAIEDFGILVKLGEKMTGLIPLIHLADVKIRKPKAKFKLQQKIKCRVLSVDSKEKKIILTSKKTLLNSKLRIITSYNTPIGTISHGVITKTKENGVVVCFYNNIYAFAPKNEIVDDNSNPVDVFSIGQPIQCRVTSSYAQQKKMFLSFRILEDSKEIESLELGSKHSGIIVGKSDEMITIKLKNGIRTILRNFHSSDYNIFNDRWNLQYSIDNSISNLMILSKPLHRSIEVTHKYLLCNNTDHIPLSIKDIKLGSIIYGFVKRISMIGIHIGFFGNLMGFVPKGEIADEFVKNPSEYFILGQTVKAYVIEIDENKIILSLKNSLCGNNGLEWLLQYFNEEKQLLKKIQKNNKKHNIKHINIGDIISGIIKDKNDVGLLITIDKYTNGLILKKHAGNLLLKDIGSPISAKVLDISQTNKKKEL